jgi:hypothetical protein
MEGASDMSADCNAIPNEGATCDTEMAAPDVKDLDSALDSAQKRTCQRKGASPWEEGSSRNDELGFNQEPIELDTRHDEE